MRNLFLIIIFLVQISEFNAQELVDSLIPIDSSKIVKSIIPAPFNIIDADTIKLGEHDEMICDSYTALGVPYVYDALHSFNRRRMDYFGGYMNVKVNAALEQIRAKGFQSDIKQLHIQIDPQTLTVHWIAVVGPSEDGNCYAFLDSRGSAGGGLSAVNKQIPRMHSNYANMNASLLLDFDENVLQCFEGNGTPLPIYSSYINIRQKFYKYATDCTNDSTNAVIVQIGTNVNGLNTAMTAAPAYNQLTKNTTYTKSKTYRVKSGDTLGQIAQRYHTSIATIKRLNHLKSDRIQIGQVIKLPY